MTRPTNSYPAERPSDQDYIDAARADVAVELIGIEVSPDFHDDMVRLVAHRLDFRAAVDSAFAAGLRAGLPSAHAEEAINVALRWNGTDGSHHKQWVIDQMLRALMGSTYDAWVIGYDAESELEWDRGIAP